MKSPHFFLASWRLGLLALFLSAPAFCQLSADEATARLRAKEDQKRIASTQPAKLSNIELEAIHLRIMVLEKENADLRQQVAALKAAAEVKPARGGRGAGGRGDTAPMSDKIAKGMSFDEVSKILGAPLIQTTDSDGHRTVVWEKRHVSQANDASGLTHYAVSIVGQYNKQQNKKLCKKSKT